MSADTKQNDWYEFRNDEGHVWIKTAVPSKENPRYVISTIDLSNHLNKPVFETMVFGCRKPETESEMFDCEDEGHVYIYDWDTQEELRTDNKVDAIKNHNAMCEKWATR